MLTWNEIRRRSAVARKGWDFARQVPRAGIRLFASAAAYRQTPPLVGNSFPKSGTHQLLQILEAFPAAVHWGSFIASTPSFTFRERSKRSHIARIRALVPGEYLGAHIFFDESYAEAMKEMNAAHYFIYRDLRDVVVSEVHYLTKMNRWHRMHRFFSRDLKTDDERITVAIAGASDGRVAYDYPNVAERMRRYLDWIGREDVCAVKYEDLNSDQRRNAIGEMVDFYSRRTKRKIDSPAIVMDALSRLDPARSHTYREGGSGRWKQHFSPRHIALFETVAGELNKALGYER